MSTISQEIVIDFIQQNIVFRSGLPESITTDQGTIFTGGEVQAFLKKVNINFLHSSPYYAQANGQAEATNRVLKKNIQKMIKDHPK